MRVKLFKFDHFTKQRQQKIRERLLFISHHSMIRLDKVSIPRLTNGSITEYGRVKFSISNLNEELEKFQKFINPMKPRVVVMITSGKFNIDHNYLIEDAFSPMDISCRVMFDNKNNIDLRWIAWDE